MSRPSTMIGIGAVLAGAAILLWLWSGDSKQPAPVEAIEARAPSAPAPIRYEGDSPPPARELPFKRAPIEAQGPQTQQQVQDKLRQELQYPPNSRPLTAADTKKVRARDHIRPLGARAAATNYFYSFNGDRLTVTGDEELKSRLVVYLDDEGKSPVPIQSIKADLVGPKGSLGSISYRDDGSEGDDRAGDHFYSNLLGSSSVAGDLPHGPLIILATFVLEDGTQGKAKLSVFFTPEGVVPAQFNGRFEERIENGSLVLSAGLNVEEAGTYVIHGNLFTTSGDPVAQATFRGPLTAGSATADLTFFGKIFHDAEAPGPYLLRNLSGYLFKADSSPKKQLMVDYPDEFQTEAHPLSGFSDAEWQGTQKSRALQSLHQN